jgi:nitrite reductase/ring-hydroxylating ferredoxin subunit
MHIDDLAVGTMKMLKVGDHRVCLVRTSEGVFAIDHACPHEGYGLTQGELQGDLLTCAWHNWKFRVTDGACVLGEEDVRSHPVTVNADGTVEVELAVADPAVQRPKLLASLRRGIESDYIGQVARDVVRLLQGSANPAELIWQGVAHGAPRAEFGWGHSIAVAADCLAMVDLYHGDQRALPLVQGLAGVAETERDRPVNPLPDPLLTVPADAAGAFRKAVEHEQLEGAQALVLAAIEAGTPATDLRRWFTAVTSDHLLSYGHGSIYAQKAFELLEMIGWERAATVLPYLVPTIVYGTREDKLPYMRPFMRELGAVDLAALTVLPAEPGWSDTGELVGVLLGRDRRAVVPAVVAALRSGAGVDGVLDAALTAVSERMLRYDVAGEFDFADDFGWLDITHGLTYAHACRWHHAHDPSPDTLRMAMFVAFLAQWTGRHEWHTTVGVRDRVQPAADDLHAYGEDLQRESLTDRTSVFIVHAHAVKTSRAAAREALHLGSSLPLDATARFMRSPKLERFVAATVTRSIEFLNGRVVRD